MVTLQSRAALFSNCEYCVYFLTCFLCSRVYALVRTTTHLKPWDRCWQSEKPSSPRSRLIAHITPLCFSFPNMHYVANACETGLAIADSWNVERSVCMCQADTARSERQFVFNVAPCRRCHLFTVICGKALVNNMSTTAGNFFFV